MKQGRIEATPSWLRVDVDPTANGFGPEMDKIDGWLRTAHVQDRARCAVRELVLEYLINAQLHTKGDTGNALPQVQISLDDQAVRVDMTGRANRRDAQRIGRAVRSFANRSLKDLQAELLDRQFSEKAPDTPGAGLGLLTIASLSSAAPLRYEPIDENADTVAFHLTSAV